MRNLQLIPTVILAFSAAAAQAEPVEYLLEYSLLAGSGGSASARMIIDDAVLTNDGVPARLSYSTVNGFPELESVELTITDTGFIDGTYTLDDLTVNLYFDAPLDPTMELLAQHTAVGPGPDFDFNFFDGGLINAVDINTFEGLIREIDGRILEQARFRLVSVTPVVAASDEDGDEIADDTDNCTETVNADQIDTDADGFGNACDPDFNNDCMVNAQDLGTMKLNFFSTEPATDMNGDGLTNFSDLGLLKGFFFEAPGPSGIAACD